MSYKEKVLIFSAPSGSGKTTLVRFCLDYFPELEFSISCTTRQARGNEQNTVDYFFISPSDFRQKIQENAFVEYEEVYEDKFYGTLKSEVERIWANKKVVIFDVDVQGGIRIKEKFAEKALSVIIVPPSIEQLEKRLILRNTDSPETIKTRVAKAKEELSFSDKFDIKLLNDDLEVAKKELIQIIKNFLRK